MKLTIGEIAKILNGEVVGRSDELIDRISELATAASGDISFLANPKYHQQLYSTQASAVLVSQSFVPTEPVTPALIKVDDPYLSFTALLELFQRLSSKEKKGFESPYFMGEECTVGADVYIGAFSYLGAHAVIGKGCKIYPHVYIGEHCEIGENTILYPGVKLYPGTKTGAYCNIQSGAVIGSHGFGFAPQKDGTYKNIPQLGHVHIGNHVDIGANTTIDCATLGVTSIADGVKIDNLVQIAHNVKIGENTVIAAQTGISGSASIGRQVRIGGQAGTVGHIHIADFTTIGARSGITKNTRSDQVLFGVPAIDRNEYLKSYAIYRKLPALMQRIEELEENLLQLTQKQQD